MSLLFKNLRLLWTFDFTNFIHTAPKKDEEVESRFKDIEHDLEIAIGVKTGNFIRTRRAGGNNVLTRANPPIPLFLKIAGDVDKVMHPKPKRGRRRKNER